MSGLNKIKKEFLSGISWPLLIFITCWAGLGIAGNIPEKYNPKLPSGFWCIYFFKFEIKDTVNINQD